MAVFLRKDRFYIDVRLDGAYGKRLRVKLPSETTETEARDAEQRVLAGRKRNPELRHATGSTVADLYPQYEIYMRLHRRSRTADDVASCGKRIMEILGAVPVESLSDAFITLYKTSRQGKVSNRTVNKELAWLSGFSSWCRKQGLAVHKLYMEPLPYQRPMPSILTPKEVAGILKAADDFHRAYFGLAYFCGLRRYEISRLQWEHVDMDGQTLQVEGKGGRYRIVPVPGPVLNWLKPLKNKSPYVFFRRGVPAYCISKGLNRIATAAKVKKHVTCHMFRHSMATHLVAANVNLRTIQEILGHSSVDVTEIYTHVAMAQKRGASEILSNAFKLDNVGQRKKALPRANPSK
jgi:integrase